MKRMFQWRANFSRKIRRWFFPSSGGWWHLNPNWPIRSWSPIGSIQPIKIWISGSSNIFLCFTPCFRKDEPNLTWKYLSVGLVEKPPPVENVFSVFSFFGPWPKRDLWQIVSLLTCFVVQVCRASRRSSLDFLVNHNFSLFFFWGIHAIPITCPTFVCWRFEKVLGSSHESWTTVPPNSSGKLVWIQIRWNTLQQQINIGLHASRVSGCKPPTRKGHHVNVKFFLDGRKWEVKMEVEFG